MYDYPQSEGYMEYIIFFGLVVVFLLFVFIQGSLEAKKEKKKFVKSLYENYGVLPKKEYMPGKMERISNYFRRHPKDGQIDDITWNDLNLDEVYKRINYTYTSAGEEYLYHTLRSPSFSRDELDYKEEQIKYFSENPDERVELQVILAEMGYSGKYSIYDYLDNLDLLGDRSNVKHIVADILIALMVILSIFEPSKGLMGLALIIVYNFTTYFKEKNEIDPYIVSFSYVMRMLGCADKICKLKDTCFEKEKDKIDAYRKGLSHFRRGSFWLMSAGRMSASGSPLDILLDYMRMMFHLDLIKFNSMLTEVRKNINNVDGMLETIGYLETIIAIGAYRNSLENWCVPQGGDNLKAEDMVHPLIDEAVSNGIKVERGILLTGSNASGKSTFLKTVAINAVLSQTIHTCLAKSFSSPFYHIYSSMALKDDLGSGESYYIVEIKSIKRILDKSRETDGKVLCFVDEVLRGTNTVERIAASTQILKCLAKENVTCFAATHDIELTELLKDVYDNYHFEEEIADGDVRFSYQIKEGRATTRNAIKLLAVMGYDDSIIKEAEDMSQRFLKNGVWHI